MPRAITGVAEPVQLHAEVLQIPHGRGVLWMTAQQANRFETQAFACGRQGVQMIGVSAAETDDAIGTGSVGGVEVFDELEPLVAADQRVDLVQAQDRELDIGGGEPVQVQGLQRGLGEPVVRREKH